MARGSSGRIVIAVEPALKRELYSVLAVEGLSLKAWFIRSATHYISKRKAAGGATREAKKKEFIP